MLLSHDQDSPDQVIHRSLLFTSSVLKSLANLSNLVKFHCLRFNETSHAADQGKDFLRTKEMEMEQSEPFNARVMYLVP